MFSHQRISGTLPETNVAPENRPSQEETSSLTIHFLGLCQFQGGHLIWRVSCTL